MNVGRSEGSASVPQSEGGDGDQPAEDPTADARAQRTMPLPLSILPRWSPSRWLAPAIPILFAGAWVTLVALAIAAA